VIQKVPREKLVMNYHLENNLKNLHPAKNVLPDHKESKEFQANLVHLDPSEKEDLPEGSVNLENQDNLELWECLEKLADLELQGHLDFVDLLVLKGSKAKEELQDHQDLSDRQVELVSLERLEFRANVVNLDCLVHKEKMESEDFLAMSLL